jgi:hypothetical protein
MDDEKWFSPPSNPLTERKSKLVRRVNKTGLKMDIYISPWEEIINGISIYILHYKSVI